MTPLRDLMARAAVGTVAGHLVLTAIDNLPDPVVIDRILAGDFTLAKTATKAERVEVVARWQGALNELERATGWRADRYRKDGAA